MLKDVSEGKSLEPPAILPSSRSQVGLGQPPGCDCGAEVGPRPALPGSTVGAWPESAQWVPVLVVDLNLGTDPGY